MADHIVSLTEEQEQDLERVRLSGAFTIIPENIDGEPSPNPEPLTKDEVVQAVIDRYLAAKKAVRLQSVLRDITPEEAEIILDRRATVEPLEPKPI